MNLAQYWAIVEEWRKLYSPPGKILIRQYNPAGKKLACRKCGKIKLKMSRHHKANDFFFAQLLPHVYASRYIQFLDADIDNLCNRCHKNWHKYLQPKVQKMYEESRELHKLSPAKQKEWCAKWKNKCLQWYENWIKKPVRKGISK